MFKHLGILAFSLLISTQISFAQSAPTNNNNALVKTTSQTQQDFILKSKYTSHEYLIQISVPNSELPTEGFPVLYVLDGNAAFDSAANIAKAIGAGANRLGLSPVAIVAIGYPNQNTFDVQKRALDYTPKASAEFQKQAKYSYGGADQFIQFIEKELKPAINSRIKINPQQQSLFGHSFGGLLVLHTFFSQPQSFQRYIAASPSLWFDNYALLNRQADWLSKKQYKNQNLMLMTTVGTHEHGKSPTPDLESLQKQNRFYQNFSKQRSDQFLYWDYKHPAEQHLTNMYASLPKAIMLAGCQPQSCSALFDEPTK
ncbi:alpha/beta hydrolase-fold protein [Acinetobacter sp. NIPH 2699]|uniref:alpha/beta hydrolase n=1 Tax=Acinetobacter sp. NIPH 2699 TaxID=2923433 RepID=UPI001F4A3693|nr:alpha/beta hydrolase-fold protein [Acinetobacter sp. NIPH 2699]MCH7336799.1 alpha/beta hydrolase-fold protein [Acinetobacter sp. NIPH 2699]